MSSLGAVYREQIDSLERRLAGAAEWAKAQAQTIAGLKAELESTRAAKDAELSEAYRVLAGCAAAAIDIDPEAEDGPREESETIDVFVKRCFEGVAGRRDAQILALLWDMEALRTESVRARFLLWAGHGHLGVLYGDDGEMQCAVRPSCDFKRDSIERIEEHIIAEGKRRLEEAALSSTPPAETAQERIVAAAIRQDGVVFTGPHHHQIIRYMVPMLGIETVSGEQGFVTSQGRYVGREEGARIAYAAGQIAEEQDTLFSEQLWSVPDWFQHLPRPEPAPTETARATGEGRVCFVGGCGKPDVNAPTEGSWPTASKFPPACTEHLYLVPPPQKREEARRETGKPACTGTRATRFEDRDVCDDRFCPRHGIEESRPEEPKDWRDGAVAAGMPLRCEVHFNRYEGHCPECAPAVEETPAPATPQPGATEKGSE